MKKTFFVLILAIFSLGVLPAQADAPATPTNILAAPVSATEINLSWSAVSGAVGYEIYRNSTITPMATTTSLSFNDNNLTPLTTHTYYLTAFDASNTKSVLSAGYTTTTLADTAKPTIPTGLVATPISTSQINLSWSTSTDNVGVTGYRIYRDGVAITTTANNYYSNIGLTATTTYSYTLTAFDAAGNESDKSSTASATTAGADTTKPTIPTNLFATPFSSSQLVLTWTAATDNVGVSGYRVFRDNVAIATTTNNYFANTGLAATTTYSYVVTAFDVAGNESDKSATATAKTLDVDSNKPTVPKNLSATAYSSSQINLNWTAASDNVGVIGYNIYRNNIFVNTAANTAFSDTGLLGATTYTYTVSAFDADGNESNRSATATATTLTGISTTARIALYNGKEFGKVINLRANQIIKIVVYSDSNFKAKNLKNKTVYFGGAKATDWWSKDVNRDGLMDRIYGFRSKDMKDLVDGDTVARFTAQTKDGQSIQAELIVQVKNSTKKYKYHCNRIWERWENVQKLIETIRNNAQKRIDEIKRRTDTRIEKLTVKANQIVSNQPQSVAQNEKKNLKKNENNNFGDNGDWQNNQNKNNKSGKQSNSHGKGKK